ncbi:MAG: MoxR family ATPase [Planctomycetes bacterium]|nr:MoxR family ATPase [Planctomycetota bacterium]
MPRPRTPRMSELAHRLLDTIGQSLRGKPDAVELALVALFAGGHLLIEDHPGVGKTLLARSMAKALDLPFQRIQCTADLLPTDIVGAQVYHPRTGELTFRPGPVFTSVLLADELNRTPPRTQSALLECMAERRVTIDRESHALPDPFFVVATQNPLTAAGTYPLPENQLDRFLLSLRLGYLDPEHEIDVVAREDGHRLADDLRPVAGRDELLRARAAVDAVRCDREIAAFMVELANRTRTNPEALLGVSTRGAQALHRPCRARAFVQGRDFVVPDDVRALLVPAWSHRMTTRAGNDAEGLLHQVLAATPMPD